MIAAILAVPYIVLASPSSSDSCDLLLDLCARAVDVGFGFALKTKALMHISKCLLEVMTSLELLVVSAVALLFLNQLLGLSAVIGVCVVVVCKRRLKSDPFLPV